MFHAYLFSALGIDDVIGNFEVGKDFDAILVNPFVEEGPFDVFIPHDTIQVSVYSIHTYVCMYILYIHVYIMLICMYIYMYIHFNYK